MSGNGEKGIEFSTHETATRRSMTFLIRKAVQADAAGIADLWRASRPDHSHLADYLERYGLSCAYPITLVATTSDDQVIGWLQGDNATDFADELKPESLRGPHAFISEIDIDPAYRRIGIGTGLFREFISLAIGANASLVALRAQDDADYGDRSAFFDSIGLNCIDGNGYVGFV